MNLVTLLPLLVLLAVPPPGGIHDAAGTGDLERVRTLLAADPRTLADTAWTAARTPLHAAIRGRHVEVVRYLVERGADVNARDRDGASALNYAAWWGPAEVVALLVDGGADVRTDVDGRGRSPLHMAALRDQAGIAALLIARGASVDGHHPDGYTPLHIAVSRGQPAVVRALLDGGADPDARWRSFGIQTPLLLAARRGDREMVDLLLARGADPERRTPDGSSVLRAAIERGDSAVVEALLARGPDLSQRDSLRGMTLLHRAAVYGRTGIALRLLDLGADVNARDFEGRTPLDCARRHAHPPAAALLRSRGGVAATGEEAFGPSPLLRKPLRRGEAVVWYLGHCGWAVKTRGTLLVFDGSGSGYGPAPAVPRLANGRIDPAEIAGLDVCVFVSHAHDDHYDRRILDWAKAGGRITYVFGWRVEGDSGHVYLPDTLETRRIGDLEIRKVNSSAEPGGAFLVRVDGVAVYHGGDLLEDATNARSLDSLATLQPRVDLLFVEPGYRSVALGTIRRFGPRVAFPMHARLNEASLRPFAAEAGIEFPATRFVCPDDPGDHWLYSRGRIR